MKLLDEAMKTLDFLRRRKRNFQLTFGQPAGQEVLIDLAKFCRATETTFNADPRIHAVLEGRREVWLRITNHLNLSPEQLFALSTGHQFQLQTEQDDA